MTTTPKTTTSSAAGNDMGTDRPFLLACAGSIAVGVVLVAVGYWLDPVRVARHWWRNR